LEHPKDAFDYGTDKWPVKWEGSSVS
jgi:hypothetical protein